MLSIFVAGTGVSTLIISPSAIVAQAVQSCNPITIENQNLGSDDWIITNPANDTDHQIKGYASTDSVAVGDTVAFYVSVTPAQTYTIDTFRLGWYNGAGGRLMDQSGEINGQEQRQLRVDANSGLIEAVWTADYSLTIPSTWISGVYLAKLTNADGFENYVSFVVRNEGRNADLLFQRSVTTDQSYNNYPNDGATGKSLYNYNSYGANTIASGKRAVKVSFNRPYSDDGAGLLMKWEIYQLRWLERNGYDVVYSTNIDTHTNGAALLDYSGFLSTGHDEYWTEEMRVNVEMARDAGVNLAFFGANAVYWQIRMEDSTDGMPNRTIVSYKNWNIDPTTDKKKKTVLWREILGRAEQTLIGIQFESHGNTNANRDYLVNNSDHWIYANTGLNDGDRVAGIVGYEVDAHDYRFPTPVSQSYTRLSSSSYKDAYGKWVNAESSIYQAPSDAWVFAAGTMSWSWGLDKPGYEDSRLQQTTVNLLDTFVGSRAVECAPATATSVPPTATHTSTATSTSTSTATPIPPTATHTLTPVPPTATSTATHTSTPVPPTATSTATHTSTPVPPTATQTATHTSTPVPPTATQTATSVPPTATSTDTPIPPTATPTLVGILVVSTATSTVTDTPVLPTATSTGTPIPPTATKTTVPPTATSTNVPPTATLTPIPPTATDTAIPPTVTSTPIPPTATDTIAPPTEISIPPTATLTPIPPTATETIVPPTVTSTNVPSTATETTVPPTTTSTNVPPMATETSIPPTATSKNVPPTATETTVPPTATSTNVPPTAMEITISPTATSTNVPPTATEITVPPTATSISVPPTATETSIPPTAIETPVPPTLTSTLVPPTATSTSTPTPMPMPMPTATATSTATRTFTSIPPTLTATPTLTAIPTLTATPMLTATPTLMATSTPVLKPARLVVKMQDELKHDADKSGGPSQGDTIRYSVSIINSGQLPATDLHYSTYFEPHLSADLNSVSTTQGTMIRPTTDDLFSIKFELGELDGNESEITLVYDVVVNHSLPASTVELKHDVIVDSNELPDEMRLSAEIALMEISKPPEANTQANNIRRWYMPILNR